MQIINKFMMLQIAVVDMLQAKEFYVDKLGLSVVNDYRQDDENWWVSLTMLEGDVTITLTTHHAHMKPGSETLYFATSNVQAAHEALSSKAIEVNDIQSDLHGPGSGTKWFNFSDPDGNLIHIEQA